MRLLLLGTEIQHVGQIRNYSGVWSFFLARELARLGHEVVFGTEAAGFDHVIALGNRYFERAPKTYRELRAGCHGAVTQISDFPTLRKSCDCNFTVRADRTLPGNRWIGWAADPEICRPAQESRTLNILIDHPDYVTGRGDITATVLRQVQRLTKAIAEPLRVRQIVDGEIREARFDGRVPTFTRKHVPFVEACMSYSQAHLFMVTHPESVGLSVLETALCGALPVVPRGFVAADLLATVRHASYDREIDWPAVLSSVDPASSRLAALQNTWPAVAGRIVEWLTSYRR